MAQLPSLRECVSPVLTSTIMRMIRMRLLNPKQFCGS